MNVYQKLMQARIKLQSTKLTKSGHNKFAGYQYFELGDFLPVIQTIFNDVGLCGTVSFYTDHASLTIVDADEPSQSIVFNSPMSSAALKGCHDVQNLGAVQTYLRRYLWVNALEIVEHDALDATLGNEKEEKRTRLPTLTDEQAEKAYNAWIEEKVRYVHDDGLVDNEALTNAWGKLASNVRTAIKKYGDGLKESELDKQAKQHLNSL